MSDESGAPDLDAGTQRRVVRDRYAQVATGSASDASGCCADDDCCGGGSASGTDVTDRAHKLGYSADDVTSVAGEANLGLGCGNPTAIASLRPGETVLDLGAGAGFDCFLAAQEVGPDGQVIGVDMTPEMVEKARANAAENPGPVEFRLGEIEHLPVADETVDVVISNCVVNLSPDKPQVFREAHRVLRPGGRLAISDVVLTASLPEAVRDDPESRAACVSGASTIDRLEDLLATVGFEDIEIDPKADSDRFIREWDPDRDLSAFLVSAAITAEKPR